MGRTRISVWLILSAVWTVAGADEPDLKQDPAKIMTAEACGECHVTSVEAWRETKHATGFDTMHRETAAEEIIGRLGLSSVKRNSPCQGCHYTLQQQGERLKSVDGVSCEMCHGAARDWIEVHNDYGGEDIDHASESPEHRIERRSKAREAGMVPPEALYQLAAGCFRCHIVSNEELVNTGRHGTGNTDFDLASRLSGEIRHNFLDSYLNGDGTENVLRPVEHQRLLFVLGRVVDVEYTLRILAIATADGVFFKAAKRRLRGAESILTDIVAEAEIPQIEEVLTVVEGLDPAPGQGAALLAAADRVGEVARAFLTAHDGSRLQLLDELMADFAE